MTRTAIRMFCAALLILSVASGWVAAQEELVAIDANHPLDSQSSIDEFERDGVVSANLTRIDMGVTVATDHAKADISGYHSDINHRFLCLAYREEIGRTIRIFFAEQYFRPRINAELESITSQTVAEVEPTREGEYSALTVTFQGPERACFKLSRERGIYFDTKGSMYEVLNNSTSFTIPRLAGSAQQWQFVRGDALANNSSVPINVSRDSLTIHYDASDDPNTNTWLPVPDCTDVETQTVCTYTKDGQYNTTYIMSTQADPPRVRYKTGSDIVADVQTWASDLAQIPGRIKETITGFFGGG